MTPTARPISETVRTAFYYTIIAFVGAWALYAIVSAAWSYGRQSRITAKNSVSGPASEGVFYYRVAGPSMVPTIIGPSVHAKCNECGRDDVFSPSFVKALRRDRICTVCGGRLALLAEKADIAPGQFELASRAERVTQGGVVRIELIDGIGENEFEVGSIVAVQWDGKLRLKRIVGLPGDTIDAKKGRLFVNDCRIEDAIASKAREFAPSLLVDDDSLQESSRWKPVRSLTAWYRDSNRNWVIGEGTREDWLVYHHQNIYSTSENIVVDDYPFNVGVSRVFSPADRLAVIASIAGDNSGARIQVAFWASDGNVLTEASQGDASAIGFYDGKRASDLPVSQETPVAVRVLGRQVTVHDLTVKRFVEYRLRPSDSNEMYPLVLADDQYFLLGDNVPVSVDSRAVGPVSVTQIRGRLTGYLGASSANSSGQQQGHASID